MKISPRIRMLIRAVLAIPLVAVALVAGSGHADATEPAATVTVHCVAGTATADVSISNTGWWWGITADMVLVESDVPGVPAGTHVTMGHPVTTTVIADHPVDLHIVASWPDVNDSEHPLTIHVGTTDCPPPCPAGTHQTGQTHTTPAAPVCEPDGSSTTTAPTATSSTSIVNAPAAPAVPVESTPAVTG